MGEFGTQRFYYLSAGAGSIRHRADPNRAVKLARRYEPFGQVLMQTGTGDPIYGYLGVQLTEVAAVLGHEDLNTTRRYTQPGEEDLHRVVGRIVTKE